MRTLREAIEQQGKGIGTRIVKVDSFLNHRLDTGLIMQMGEAFAAHFAPEKPDLVLTVEASGIALALACAHALNDIPVLFAKKSSAANQSEDMLEAPVFSFTHQESYTLRCDRRYLPKGARVLIIDDFLANGEAVAGLRTIIRSAQATLVGVGIAVEKGFQDGGQKLRLEGVNLLSLAVVRGIDGGKLRLDPETEIKK